MKKIKRTYPTIIIPKDTAILNPKTNEQTKLFADMLALAIQVVDWDKRIYGMKLPDYYEVHVGYYRYHVPMSAVKVVEDCGMKLSKVYYSSDGKFDFEGIKKENKA